MVAFLPPNKPSQPFVYLFTRRKYVLRFPLEQRPTWRHGSQKWQKREIISNSLSRLFGKLRAREMSRCEEGKLT